MPCFEPTCVSEALESRPQRVYDILMGGRLAGLAIALTMMSVTGARALPIAAAPCATGPSIERRAAAMQPFLPACAGAPPASALLLLDCTVGADQRLRCEAPHHTASPYDLSGAALAF